jgi:class 3 adenylate cyclase
METPRSEAVRIAQDLPPGVEFEHKPVQLWVLVTIELCISYAGRDYLVVTQPYYPDPLHPTFEGSWAPPFMGYPLDIGYYAPATAGELLERFDEAASEAATRSHVDEMTYSLGLENPATVWREPFTEVKDSPRTPGALKAFHVVRYGIRLGSARALANAADPEGHHGFAFLPLDPSSPYLQVRPDDGTMLFRSRPLYSNLQCLLNTPRLCAETRSLSNELTSQHFSISRRALIVAIDINGFGACAEYLRENELNPFGDPSLGERWFESVSAFLSDFVARAGFRWTQPTGDGVLASLPIDDGTLSDAVCQVLEAIEGLCEEIFLVNRNVGKALSLGLRAAVHVGDVSFGRTAGPITATPSFSGDALVVATRLQDVTKIGDVAPDADFTVVLSSSLPDGLLVPLPEGLAENWLELESVEAQVKERIVSGRLLARQISNEGQS